MFKNFVNVFKNIIRPFKHYRQLEQSDCGFACVRMIANYYGKNVSLDYLHANFEINKLGISIKDLLDCFNLVNIEAHPVKVGIDLLK